MARVLAQITPAALGPAFLAVIAKAAVIALAAVVALTAVLEIAK